MKGRIAVATKDGKVVTDHFGHCERYTIVEVNLDGYQYLEQRGVTPPCIGGDHSTEAIVEVIEKLSDCKAILVNQIGGGALRIVEKYHIAVYEYTGFVKDGLEKII